MLKYVVAALRYHCAIKDKRMTQRVHSLRSNFHHFQNQMHTFAAPLMYTATQIVLEDRALKYTTESGVINRYIPTWNLEA